MYRKFIPAAAAAIMMSAGAASATVINDGQLILPFTGNAANGGGWVDVIGDNNIFQTSQIVTSMMGSTLKLTITTNFADEYAAGINIGGVLVNAADIFIRQTGSGPTWTHAITLGKQGLPAGFFAVNNFATSIDIHAPLGAPFTYGGNWYTCDNGGDPCVAGTVAPVRVTSGQQDLAKTVSVSTIGTNTIIVTVSNWSLSQFDLFWGTGDCSNDAIYGGVDTQVSEPASLALLGMGLLGLAAIRRRKAA